MDKKHKMDTSQFDAVANDIAGTATPWNRDMKNAAQDMSRKLRGKVVAGFVHVEDEDISALVFEDGTALKFFDVIKHPAGVVVYSYVSKDADTLKASITRVSFESKVLNVSETTDDDGNIEGYFNLSSSIELFGEVKGKEVNIGMVLCAIHADADSDFAYNTRISYGDYDGDMDFESNFDDLGYASEEEIAEADLNLTAELNKRCRGANVENYHSTDDLHGMVFYMSNGVSFTIHDVNKSCEFDVLTRDGVEDMPCKKFEYGFEAEMVNVGNGPEAVASILRFYHSKISKRPSIQLIALIPDDSPDDERMLLGVTFNNDAVN